MIESLFNPEFMTRELAFGMNLAEFLTILAMLVMTYSTRLLGWLFLKNRRFSVRTQALLEAAPGCVMVSIAASLPTLRTSAHWRSPFSSRESTASLGRSQPAWLQRRCLGTCSADAAVHSRGRHL